MGSSGAGFEDGVACLDQPLSSVPQADGVTVGSIYVLAAMTAVGMTEACNCRYRVDVFAVFLHALAAPRPPGCTALLHSNKFSIRPASATGQESVVKCGNEGEGTQTLHVLFAAQVSEHICYIGNERLLDLLASTGSNRSSLLSSSRRIALSRGAR